MASGLPFRTGFSGIETSEAPSSADLPRHPFAFTPDDLLTEREFSKATRERGVALQPGQLEELHRRRLLVPILKVHQRPVISPAISPSASPSPYLSVLEVATGEGRVSDPSRSPFRPWGRRSEHLYSRFQLVDRTDGCVTLRLVPEEDDACPGRRPHHGTIAAVIEVWKLQ